MSTIPALVGNDVVDLGDPDAVAAVLRRGFLERVCTPAEAAAVRAASAPALELWARFAAKEAAYKVLAKQRPDTVLAHRSFETSADLRSIMHAGQLLHLSVDLSAERVHAVASTSPAPQLVAVGPLVPGGDASAAVRVLLRERAAGLLGCDAAELEVRRDAIDGSWDGYGPPRLVRAGSPVDLDISLSHDGRFVAVAAIRG